MKKFLCIVALLHKVSKYACHKLQRFLNSISEKSTKKKLANSSGMPSALTSYHQATVQMFEAFLAFIALLIGRLPKPVQYVITVGIVIACIILFFDNSLTTLTTAIH